VSGKCPGIPRCWRVVTLLTVATTAAIRCSVADLLISTPLLGTRTSLTRSVHRPAGPGRVESKHTIIISIQIVHRVAYMMDRKERQIKTHPHPK